MEIQEKVKKDEEKLDKFFASTMGQRICFGLLAVGIICGILWGIFGS